MPLMGRVKNAVKALFTTDKHPATEGYRPLPVRLFRQPRDLPYFTFATIEAMLMDQTVKLGLAMRAAAIVGAKFGRDQDGQWVDGAESPSEEVAKFVDDLRKQFWKKALPKVIKAQTWGWMAGEIIWKQQGDKILFDDLLERHARDVIALESRGRLAGVRFKRVAGESHVDLRKPKAFWHSYQPESDSYYGQSICHGAYSPWADKWLDGGALDVRRLFMRKDSYTGVRGAYPPGTTNIDGKGEVPNRDIMREMIEQAMAGNVVALPRVYDEGGREMWDWTPAQVSANPAHILQYPKDCDVEILRGLEIPDDVLMSQATGAWQGKQVPMDAYFTGLDLWLSRIVDDFETQVAEPAVYYNFGKAIDFNCPFQPLGEQAMERHQGGEQPPGGEQAPPPGADPGAMQMSLRSKVAQDGAEKIVQRTRRKIAARLSAQRLAREGDTRVNRAGHREVLRGGRWHLDENESNTNKPSGGQAEIHSSRRSKATVKVKDFTKDQKEAYQRTKANLFGADFPDEKFADVVGAPDDAHVLLSSYGDHIYAQGTIEFDDESEAKFNRQVYEDWIYNESFEIPPQHQGGGLGMQVFSAQVEKMIESGFKRIECWAAREDDPDNKMFGYYVWPRLGYDGEINPKLKSKLPKSLSSANRISDLMKSKEGREWWKENGDSFLATFDLSEGSLSRRVLSAYQEEKKNRKQKMALSTKQKSGGAGEEIFLSEEDDAILDAVWEKLSTNRKKLAQAPKGGVNIDGKFYPGGQFIPGKSQTEVDQVAAQQHAETGDEPTQKKQSQAGASQSTDALMEDEGEKTGKNAGVINAVFSAFSKLGGKRKERIAAAKTTGKGVRSKIVSHGPIGAQKGTNSAYMVKLENGSQGVYKPKIGENMNILRSGFPHDQQYKREAAASIIDKALGFGLVPETVLSEGHKGLGSVQEFFGGGNTFSDLQEMSGGDPRFSYKGLVESAGKRTRERLAVFDLITGNKDRHSANIMARPKEGGGLEIALIDNGLSFGEPGGYTLNGAKEPKPRKDGRGQYYPKIRTFAHDLIGENENLSRETVAALDNLAENKEKITAELTQGEQGELLTKKEIDAFWERVDKVRFGSKGFGRIWSKHTSTAVF